MTSSLFIFFSCFLIETSNSSISKAVVKSSLKDKKGIYDDEADKSLSHDLDRINLSIVFNIENLSKIKIDDYSKEEIEIFKIVHEMQIIVKSIKLDHHRLIIDHYFCEKLSRSIIEWIIKVEGTMNNDIQLEDTINAIKPIIEIIKGKEPH